MAHNPEVEGSNPSPATKARGPFSNRERAFCMWFVHGFVHGAPHSSRTLTRSDLHQGGACGAAGPASAAGSALGGPPAARRAAAEGRTIKTAPTARWPELRVASFLRPIVQFAGARLCRSLPARQVSQRWH